jgi:3'(2'), 5'-bisphosphate nucleotidase
MTAMLEVIQDIAITAGDEIMKVYEDADRFGEVEHKADNSPLTVADRRAHEIISHALEQAFPDIPILSEEGNLADYATRSQWQRFWLVDPLDGTKEFIHRNGEFTVNIALIENGRATTGVVHAPALQRSYCGDIQQGGYRIDANGNRQPLKVNQRSHDRVAVRSKSHAAPEEEAVLKAFGISDCVSVGSSLKFCFVADGTADLYYRHGPTMEWDVAAGQAVVESAGGRVLAGTGPEPFRLNKQNLLNGSFLCLGFESDEQDQGIGQ